MFAFMAAYAASGCAQIPKIDPEDRVLESRERLLWLMNPIGCRGQYGRQWIWSYGDTIKPEDFKRYRHDSERKCVHADFTAEGRQYKKDWHDRHYYDKKHDRWVEKDGKWYKKPRSRTKAQ